ncbi:hypothetical protein FXB40_36380 [Bradyrhizobium rifense]|uniref:Uncharacterized protein n=1 Tax=Bradyrhizobium rifense TaxID=515499 RepID=A0A5D3K3X4_9BRAD|nr:hypothetical protein FXB40_36380 [Bradyrhizobium rifense]
MVRVEIGRGWGRRSLHSLLRAQRSNPESLRGKILDCFVAPAQNCFAILSRAPRNDGMRAVHPSRVPARYAFNPTLSVLPHDLSRLGE